MAANGNGYLERSSGLLVPVDAGRTREVWTKADWKLLNKAGAFLASRGMAFHLVCLSSECKGVNLEQARDTAGRTSLRCKCKDRVFEKAF